MKVLVGIEKTSSNSSRDFSRVSGRKKKTNTTATTLSPAYKAKAPEFFKVVRIRGNVSERMAAQKLAVATARLMPTSRCDWEKLVRVCSYAESQGDYIEDGLPGGTLLPNMC
jgi:hypothetical protein